MNQPHLIGNTMWTWKRGGDARRHSVTAQPAPEVSDRQPWQLAQSQTPKGHPSAHRQWLQGFTGFVTCLIVQMKGSQKHQILLLPSEYLFLLTICIQWDSGFYGLFVKGQKPTLLYLDGFRFNQGVSL